MRETGAGMRGGPAAAPAGVRAKTEAPEGGRSSAAESIAAAMPHCLVILVVGSLLLLAEFRFSAYQSLVEEDEWVEWTTFLAFAVAGGLALGAARRSRLSRGARLFFAGISLFCIFVAGEEISWGQRVLGFRPPEYFLENNAQQEANVHNLVQSLVDPRLVVGTIAILYGLVLPLLVRLGRIPRTFAPAPALAPWFVLVAGLEAFRPYFFASEISELTLGLLFLADVLDRGWAAGGVAGPDRLRRALPRVLVPLGTLALGALGAPIVDSLQSVRSRARVPEVRDELRTLRADMLQPGVLGESLVTKSRVHKRLFAAVEKGYLRLPGGDHYLDPWNQPYWLLFGRTGEREAVVVVYSYGPNRRRDSDVAALFRLDGDPGEALRGDDLGMVIELREEP